MARPKYSNMKCPKCSKQGYIVVERKYYLRVLHKVKVGKKWKNKYCYFGSPENIFNRLHRIYDSLPDSSRKNKMKQKMDNLPDLDEYSYKLHPLLIATWEMKKTLDLFSV